MGEPKNETRINYKVTQVTEIFFLTFQLITFLTETKFLSFFLQF